jgi:hypothetical protein
MNGAAMPQFLMGAIAMAYAVAGLFFLRFWRATRDRLFAIFAVALWLLGLIRVALTILGEADERTAYLYWVRFAAYALILMAIVDKNRPPPRR